MGGLETEGSFYIFSVASIEIEKVTAGVGRVRIRIKDANGNTGLSVTAWGGKVLADGDLAMPEVVVLEQGSEENEKHTATD